MPNPIEEEYKTEYDWTTVQNITNESCLAAQVEDGRVEVINCDSEQKSICIVDSKIVLTLRGLCKYTYLDRFYKPVMALESVTWIGNQGTTIWFNDSSDKFNIR